MAFTAVLHRHVAPGFTLAVFSVCALGILVTFLFLLPYRETNANQACIAASVLMVWACFCTVLLHVRDQPEVQAVVIEITRQMLDVHLD
jgi:hypothetical protein